MMNYGKVEQIGSRRLQCKGMYELLQQYAREGIALYLEGKEAEPGQIAATCLREGVSYMMDFIPENQSNQMISKIDFTKVDPEPDPDLPCSGKRTIEDPHPNIAILHCS
jgi:hypothetical protein